MSAKNAGKVKIARNSKLLTKIEQRRRRHHQHLRSTVTQAPRPRCVQGELYEEGGNTTEHQVKGYANGVRGRKVVPKMSEIKHPRATNPRPNLRGGN